MTTTNTAATVGAGYHLVNTTTGQAIVWSHDLEHITALAKDFNDNIADQYRVTHADQAPQPLTAAIH